MSKSTPAFAYHDGELCAEGVSLARIAEEVGTPAYVYSATALEDRYRQFSAALAGLPALLCFAVKANSNQAVIRTFAELGAGADVVSEGELRRALAAGVPARKIVFAGVGKTKAEMAFALKAGIHQFNVESEPELIALGEVAASLGLRADFALRINPDVDAKTHAKISTGKAENKFGVPWTRASALFAEAAKLAGLNPVGLAVHIGSQLTDLEPYERAFRRLVQTAEDLRREGHDIRRIDFGGGLGVAYRNEAPPPIRDYVDIVRRLAGHLKDCEFIFEPGRWMVAEAGILLSAVVFVKKAEQKTFVILDAAMNDLIRPSLYDAWMAIEPVRQPRDSARITADFVGPVCESGDVLGLARETPPLVAGDKVAILSAGAYGAVMASTYNTRLLVPEVMVRGTEYAVIRRRASYDELIGLDHLPDWQTSSRQRGSA